MTMGLCKDCRWWDADGPHIPQLEQEDKTRGVCELAGSTGSTPEHSHSLAVAIDQDTWGAALRTSPDFGCVQFEKREGS